ncbi:MAG: hypothetical protein RLZ32_482, partial [Gemmatimonadota bacterium]
MRTRATWGVLRCQWRCLALCLPLCLLVAGCARTPATDGRVVAEWMAQLYGTIRAERLSPPVASRLSAYAAVALYAGVAAGDPSLPPLATVLPRG